MIELPHKPGCYIFKDKKGTIIYIGKARDLRKRVASYFNRKDLDPKTFALVKSISFTDFIVTHNEVEALILENNLIKKNQPKYNINLKDSKRYAYIEITKEDFPRILIARTKDSDGNYFGPFVSGAERDYVLSLLRKIFSVRTCKKIPKRPCLRYHIKLCDAPCSGLISREQYADKIQKVKLVLKGKNDELLKILEGDMKRYSEKHDFERCIMLREQINAINYLSEKQNMERQKRYDEDILNYVLKDGKVYLMIFNIYKGVLANKSEFVFEFIDNFLEDFLVQYYSDNKSKKELILPREIDDSLKKFLLKHNVKVNLAKKGEKKKLLELVISNIESSYFGNLQKIKHLAEKLRLHEMPKVIECFDVSHLSGTSTVGSMVQFRDGMPDKSNYRRFRIRTVEGIDDIKAISEVVNRRYLRLKEEKTALPDLIIIDGGKGQLNAALDVLDSLELEIPVISIAKREEEIYFPGLNFPIKLKKNDKALLFIREIRDEAHRFAITYNRLLRSIK